MCVKRIDDDIGAKIVLEYNCGITCECNQADITNSIVKLLQLHDSNEFEKVFELKTRDEIGFENRGKELKNILLSQSIEKFHNV